MFSNLLFKSSPLSPVRGVYLDGTAYLTLSEVLSSDQTNADGLFSFWWRMPNPATAHRFVYWGKFVGFSGFQGMRILTRTGSLGSPQIAVANTSRINCGNWYNDTGYGTDQWRHFLFGWNNGNEYMYLDGVAESFTLGEDLLTSYTVNYDWSTHYIGYGIETGQSPIIADLAEVYFAMRQWVDITQESNRLKFITAQGFPADLGTDGSGPTGTAPNIYCSLRDDDASVNAFATNRGSGGNFSIVGTLQESSSKPRAA